MRTTIVAGILAVGALAVAAGGASAASLVSAKKLEYDVETGTGGDASKELWAKIGGWCAIQEWHPAVEKCEESKEGDDSFRTLTLKGGGAIKEKLLASDAGSYRYEIIESPLPVTNYTALLAVAPEGDDLDEVKLTWSATYDPAEGKEAKEARDTIDGIFQAGIDSIKAAHVKDDDGKDDDDDND